MFPLCPRVLMPASVFVSAHGSRECNTFRQTLVSVVTCLYPSLPLRGRPSRSIVRGDTRNFLKMTLFSEIPSTEGIHPVTTRNAKLEQNIEYIMGLVRCSPRGVGTLPTPLIRLQSPGSTQQCSQWCVSTPYTQTDITNGKG